MGRYAFDVGGVMSKFPSLFREMMLALQNDGHEVYVISDMHPEQKILYMLYLNGFGFVKPENVISANYSLHGEFCKAKVCEDLSIDVLVDDFIGYVGDGTHLRLLVMPDSSKPYYADDWTTDKSEGDFGRRKRNG